MNDLSTKVKKLNIFQKIRLNYYQRNAGKLSAEKFFKLPSYIKNNENVVNKIVFGKNFSDEELRKISPELVLKLRADFKFIDGYSTGEIYEFLKNQKVDLYSCSKEEKLLLALRIIDSDKQDALEFEGWGNGETFKELNQDILKKYKEDGQLEKKLPIIIKYLDKSIKDIIILEKKPELIKYLDREEQLQYINKNKAFINYLPQESQLEIIKGDLGFFSYAPIDIKKQYIKENPEDFIKISLDSKIELVSHDARLYDYLTYDEKFKLKSSVNTKEESLDAAVSLLKKDRKNIRIFGTKSPNMKFLKLFDGIEEQSDETIKDYILHSKLTSAIGTLTSADFILHGTLGREEIISGIDEYDYGQIEIFHKMSPSQISNLVKTDVNYILPYLAGFRSNILQENEKYLSIDRAKKTFIEIFGEDKFLQFEKSIDQIYKKQIEYNEYIKENGESKNKFQIKYKNFSKEENIPLEEFKILFNSQIIESCNPEQIERYLEKKLNRNDSSQEFLEIIRNAYGEKTTEILKSRPGLNSNSINSLEVFDKRILDTYGEAFVHDCISYNLRDFSEFLDVTKDEKESEIFYTYYSVLKNILGENVETMQKAISEYSYVKEILHVTHNQDLTEKQLSNLIAVLYSDKNKLDIKNIEQLEQYDKLANEKLNQDIKEMIALNADKDTIKDVICNNLFGLDYSDGWDKDYGISVKTITSLYDFSNSENEETQYSDIQKKFINILSFIENENDIEKLVEFTENIEQFEGLRNPIALNTVLNSVIDRQTAEMNKQLISIEKLNEICESEARKDEPLAYYEEIDGLPIYHLNGVPFCTLGHTAGISFNDISWNDNIDIILKYEGQGGNSAICSRLITGKLGDINSTFLYGQLENNSVITINDTDAQTQHTSKKTKMYALPGNKKVNELETLTEKGNEISFYRRNRSHRLINNENSGGKIRPMAYGTTDLTRISSDLMKKLKDEKIPIFVLHSEKYKKQDKEQEKESEQKGEDISL